MESYLKHVGKGERRETEKKCVSSYNLPKEDKTQLFENKAIFQQAQTVSFQVEVIHSERNAG